MIKDLNSLLIIKKVIIKKGLFVQLSNHQNLIRNNQMASQDDNLQREYPKPPPNYPLSKHRTHGLSQNVSWAQVLSSLLIVAEIVVYFTCVNRIKLNTAVLVLYSISGVIGVIAAALATLYNPTDWIVYYYKGTDPKKDKSFKYDMRELRYCGFCDSYCFKSSKHCKQCNRCVQTFDHHCVWFNNCVGKGNYRYFFVAIVALFVHMGLFIAHLVDDTVYLAKEQRIVQSIGIFVVSWIVAIVLIVFDVLLINLIGLHVYLIAVGMTTYEFLTREKKQAQTANQKSRAHNRVASYSGSVQERNKQSSNRIIQPIKKEPHDSSKSQGTAIKQKVTKQILTEESLRQIKKNFPKIQDFSHDNSHYKNDQLVNEFSYTNLTNLNSQVIKIRQNNTQNNDQTEIEPKNYLACGELNQQKFKEENLDNDSKRCILEYKYEYDQKSMYSLPKIDKTNAKSRQNHTISQQKTQDMTLKTHLPSKDDQPNHNHQLQQKNNAFPQRPSIQEQSQIPYSQKATVKSNEIKEKQQFDIRDQIIEENSLQVRSVNHPKDKCHSEKTIKKESRLKTFVAFTKQQEFKQLKSSKKKAHNQLSDRKISMFRNYFERNRSLKFILNGSEPHAISPRKISVGKNHQVSEQEDKEISLAGGQFQLISKSVESKNSKKDYYFDDNLNEKDLNGDIADN